MPRSRTKSIHTENEFKKINGMFGELLSMQIPKALSEQMQNHRNDSRKSKLNQKGIKRSISFNEKVVEIPSIATFDDELKLKLWYTRDEVKSFRQLIF